MKVIYVFEQRHCYNYDYNMFQMKYFDKDGVDIEIWSAVRWTFKNNEDPADISFDKNTFYINNIDDLKSNFERVKNDNCIFLCYPYHSYTLVSYSIRKYIKKYGFKFCNISGSPCLGKQRLIKSKNPIFLFIMQILRSVKLFVSSMCKLNFAAFNNAIYCLVGPLLYKSQYNFTTTDLANSGFPNWIELCDLKKNIVIHSNSYDEFLDISDNVDEFYTLKSENKIPDKYVLLIDDYEIGHSDFKKFGLNLPVTDPNVYLCILNKFLSIIENKFNMPVVIAEHPKAEYKKNDFNGRISIRNHTNVLIKNASLIVVGVSTCIGLMLLCKKDYIGFYSSEFFVNTPQLKDNYDIAHKELGCEFIDIRNNESIDNIDRYINKYDKTIYNNYIEKYVVQKNGVIDKRFYEVVADKMLEGN